LNAPHRCCAGSEGAKGLWEAPETVLGLGQQLRRGGGGKYSGQRVAVARPVGLTPLPSPHPPYCMRETFAGSGAGPGGSCPLLVPSRRDTQG